MLTVWSGTVEAESSIESEIATDSDLQSATLRQETLGESDAEREQPAESWIRDWGGLLRTARQIAGLSLAQLSHASGLSKGYLSKLESSAPGAMNPSRSTLASLARALPSFRPLAHTLAPGLGAEQLDYTRTTPTGVTQVDLSRSRRSLDTGSQPEHEPLQDPIRIGWRELEVLVALTSLERAALPFRISEPMVARATGRVSEAVHDVLDRLVSQDVVTVSPPVRHGELPTYRLSAHATNQLGVSRLGDVLILAATLLSSNLPDSGTRSVRTER